LPNIKLCDVSWKTGILAGALRAKYRMPLPDMFQAACAIEHGGVLITNDKVLKKVSEIDVVLLSCL
jgi:predicted nucleic acid-binding protein